MGLFFSFIVFLFSILLLTVISIAILFVIVIWMAFNINGYCTVMMVRMVWIICVFIPTEMISVVFFQIYTVGCYTVQKKCAQHQCYD